MKEKYFKFSVGNMAYYIQGSGAPIVILHGWGQNFYSFKSIVEELKERYLVIGVDFLGFGLSDEPSVPLKIQDYTFHLTTLLELLDIRNPSIIAHSFGGRIAIHYASKNKVDKLLLTSSAGIKNKSIKKYFNIYKYKVLKRIYKLFSKKKYEDLIKNSGSNDYKKSSFIMKKTLSNIVGYSSIHDIKRIKAKTYLLWGINDDQTKFSECIKMNKLIKDSIIISFYESGHFCYLEEKDKFIREVKTILEEN